RAGLYDDLEKVERLLEEHAHSITLYPSRAADLEKQIEELLSQVSWKDELPDKSLQTVTNYLCEIKESQIRSGLHVLGINPAGEHRKDFLLSLLRLPSAERPGLLQLLAGNRALETLTADERDQVESKARRWVDVNDGLSDVASGGSDDREKAGGAARIARASEPALHGADGQTRSDLAQLANFLGEQPIPRLARCDDEIKNVFN